MEAHATYVTKILFKLCYGRELLRPTGEGMPKYYYKNAALYSAVQSYLIVWKFITYLLIGIVIFLILWEMREECETAALLNCSIWLNWFYII